MSTPVPHRWHLRFVYATPCLVLHSIGAAARRTAAMPFLLSKRHVSTDVCWGYQQPTVISTVHEVAVRAALAVWALGICGVGIKLPVATSKLLLGQPSHASRVLNWQQLLHVGLPVFAGVHKHQPCQQLFSQTVMIMILVQPFIATPQQPVQNLASRFRLC